MSLVLCYQPQLNYKGLKMKKQYSIGKHKNLTIADLMALATYKPELFNKDQLKMILDIKEKFINDLYNKIRGLK